MDRLRRLGRDEGQSAAEFIGVLAAVALLVALLAASSIAPVVSRATSATTCKVLNNPSCGSPGSVSPFTLDPPRAAPIAAEAGDAAEPRSYPGNPDTAEQNLLDNVFGFGRGVGSQLGDMITGVADALGWGWRTITSEEQRVENWALWEQIRDRPGESLRAIWDGITAPILAEWQAGRPGAAFGRGLTEIAGIFFGTKGLDKIRALAAANRLGDGADAARGLAGLGNRLADETGAIRLGRAAEDAGRYVDLVSPARRRHILDGDGTGGGHRGGRGLSGKSEFPTSWSDDRIIHEISDVATDPSSTVRAGRGGRTIVTSTRDGIDIQVVLDRRGEIVTGFPTNVTRNP